MPKFYDTMLAEYIKNPGVRGIGLDKLSVKEFNYMMQSFDYITEKGKIKFEDLSVEKAAIYSAEDVYITHKLFEKQKEDGVFENTILQEIEIPLIQVLKYMEITGVKISRDILKGIGILLENETKLLEKKIYEHAGVEFNIKSPKQVGEILFEKLALPKGKKTKTGFSVSAEVLGELAHDYEIAQLIVDYRHFTKVLSTYVNGLIDVLDENDFLHTNYNQTVTSTGRLSSTNPNLQNIPTNDGIAGEIRGAFVSRFENGKIMALDYSQIEVRILAILSGDENLLSAFQNKEDIHRKTGEFLFPNETITSSKRKIAKAVNFGVIYGISGFGLSKMIGKSVKESKEYIDTFFDSYPKVRMFLDETIKDCEEKGYVQTIFGRKRFIANINDRNKMMKNAAEREAINMPIQGTNADIIKIAMIRSLDFLKTPLQNSPITGEKIKGGYSLKSKMIMQVHDELVFDIFPGEETVVSDAIKSIMEGVLDGEKIPLKVDVNIGTNWREAK